jgi:subtilisin family serine protease
LRPNLLVLVALAACTAPHDRDRVSPILADALDAAKATDLVRVIAIGPRADVDDVGGTVVAGFDHVAITVADVTPAQAWALADSGVGLATDAPIAATGTPPKPLGVSYAADPDLIRRSIGADLVHAGLAAGPRTGKGAVVALIDSGVDATQTDLPKDAVVAYGDFVGFVDDGSNHAIGKDEAAIHDPYGHGTMVAGVLVGTRVGSTGVSPGAKLISARVLDADGAGRTSDAIAALDWIVANRDATGIRVVNFSIGAAPAGSFTVDPLDAAVESAVEDGLVVVAAAGNYGWSDGAAVYGGITSPANDPLVITVGAVDPHGTARRSDDGVAPFSSRGPTVFDGLGKPDLVAPGQGLALTAPPASALYLGHPGARLASWTGVPTAGAKDLVASGTSFAAPMVAGTVALMLEADPTLRPTEVKAMLELTASDAGDPTLLSQGAGELDAAGAVRLAAWWHAGGPAPTTSDTLSGEAVPWSLRILWDGYDTHGDPLPYAADGMLAVGDVGGSGILWDGATVRYVGVTVSGPGLLDPRLAAWSDLWGQGILWDGSMNVASGRVWATPATWSALVWPGNLATSGTASPLFAAPTFTHLTVPVSGAASPVPLEPDFAP